MSRWGLRILHRLMPLLMATLALFPLSNLPRQAMAASPPLVLHGRIQRLWGNRMPGLSVPPLAPAADQELVLVEGQLRPLQLGDPFLPAARLRAPVLARHRSDANGQFRLALPSSGDPPDVVTVLLVVPGGYYLNAFDHTGCFASLALPAATQQPLLLRDDRGATF